MIEHFFTCPYCWQEISMILDQSDESSDYIEDCEVCCRPIEIRYLIEDDRLIRFTARPIDGIQ